MKNYMVYFGQGDKEKINALDLQDAIHQSEEIIDSPECEWADEEVEYILEDAETGTRTIHLVLCQIITGGKK